MNRTTTYPQKFPLPAMGGYRHFFNGQEGDDEVLGEGGFQNYGFHMYDTRIARFWGVDPLAKNYPMLTPFQFAKGEPYSVGLKIYNNPWGKLSIDAGTGWAGYKQDWSPDINFPDPIISVSSQYFQFFFSTLDKNDILFDVKRDNNSNINNKLLDYNAKSNQKTSKDQENK